MPFPTFVDAIQPRFAHDVYDEGAQQRHALRLPMRAFATYALATPPRPIRGRNRTWYPTCLNDVLAWRGGSLELRGDCRQSWYDLGVLPRGVVFSTHAASSFLGDSPISPLRLSAELRPTNSFHELLGQNRPYDTSRPFLVLLLAFLQPNWPPTGLLLTRVGFWETGTHTFAAGRVPEVSIEATADLDARLVDRQTMQPLPGYALRNWAYAPVNPPAARASSAVLE